MKTHLVQRRVVDPLDAARGHLDTAMCHLMDAAGYCEEGDLRSRLEEIIDQISAILAKMDRLREST